MTSIRCAIYTRKSSDEGLEQDFNSLDAQREACAAYILSQASEGWKLSPERYDDGGLSGGTLKRPALQRLLADIKQGLIDIIVVYKVDRLTRSLLDFSKLVEAFDAARVSFVSVTQSFNTTTSMGRLTLNMLLSFAQFEREVTAERIRDKIAASKAKGMWMGGIPPLGYAPEGRSLAIVEEHAALIRNIYSRYRELGNVRLLAETLDKQGVTTPIRKTGKGKRFGGCRFTRGQLYAILRNPIYAGDIAHKDQTFAGNHKAIIAREEWDAVQRMLADNRQGIIRKRQESRRLLSGLLFDEHGIPLQAMHTSKGQKRYGYYVRQSGAGAATGPASSPLRIPAREIEQVMRQAMRELLARPLELAETAELAVVPSMLGPIETSAADLAAKLLRGGSAEFWQLVSRVVAHPDRLEVSLSRSGLAKLLGLSVPANRNDTFNHRIDARLQRSGLAVRLVQENGTLAGRAEPDAALVRLLLQAREWWGELSKGEHDIASLSRKAGVTASWMTRVVRLAFLAPDVVEAILDGRTRTGIDAKALLAPDAVALEWSAQRETILPADCAPRSFAASS